MNKSVPHVFAKGMSSDLDNHIKEKDTYALGINGRIYTKDGALSFTSIDGTTEVYNNPKIVKYLGWHTFLDQIVIFVKCTGIEVVDVDTVHFNDNYSPGSSLDSKINYTSYYSKNSSVPNYENCPVNTDVVPPNNTDYTDCIMTLQYDDAGNLFEKVIWSGYQNWPLDGKILTEGVDENSKYRRVKYTDNLNVFRSINVLNPNLYKKKVEQLANFQGSILLEPRIVKTNTNGQLKSMAVQYFYRLITDSGQVTEFSPPSKIIYIYPTDDIFRGGRIEETTNKSVTIQCNVIEWELFNEIEVVALEFEANGLPTAIKSLGIRQVAEVNEFNHFGSEPEFQDDFTLADLLETKINWKYCSDMKTKNNKLFVSGLRNDPLFSDFNQLKYDFALHGWNDDGTSHTSFINPDPIKYNKIPIGVNDKMYYVNRRYYSSIKVFQSSIVSFENTATGLKYSFTITNDGNFYIEYLKEISDWLLNIHDTYNAFNTNFPNLKIEFIDNVLLLSPIDDSINTDFSVYKFTYTTSQVIDNYDDELVFKNTVTGGTTKIDGALSAGFNSGNGIRITFRMVDEEIMTKATSVYKGTGPILNFKDPSFKKSMFKGEIYRLGINFYKDGERLFAIPIGDLKIPNLGDTYSYINDSGNHVISGTTYVNQKVVGNKLYGVRVEMRVEVRLDCRFSKNIDSYQILHVQRTEENRTILAQGISAPLLRLQDPVNFKDPEMYILDERLRRKWMLPYYGGPTYDKQGFDIYDTHGNEYSENTYAWEKRTIHSRKMMYVDAPDVIYGEISDNLIEGSSLEIVGKLNTDHTPSVIMESGEPVASNAGFNENMASKFGTEIYPKFSRKILNPQLKHLTEVDDLPKHVGDEKLPSFTIQSHFINVSVFSNFTPYKSVHQIDSAISLLPGEVKSGSNLNTGFDISNNAMCLPSMPWWFSNDVRIIEEEDDQHKWEAMLASNISFGQKTMFIKSSNDVFSSAFVGPVVLPTPNPQILTSGNGAQIYDTHALVNIKRTNTESIYGGRSELAFSKNVFIPLSETIPVNKSDNSAQISMIEGDTYVTLHIRTKNTHGDKDEIKANREINNGRGKSDSDVADLVTVYLLNGAWTYAAVIETMVEPKLSSDYEFYREKDGIDFSIIPSEVLNSAYLKKNDTKLYVPQPYRFTDDPILTNIVAASLVKLSGQYYDAWSSFPVNEFQELDKNKGVCFNLVKFKDNIYAIQESQTSLLNIDRDVMIPTEGKPINVKQGAGKSIDGYQIISKYGTSIRRGIVSDDTYGFGFIDEHRNLLIKNDKPVLVENQYHHDFFSSLELDPIIDLEGYYDDKFYESCFLIKQQSGLKRVLSYNEVLKSLNGYYEYDAPLFINFKDKIFAPIENATESKSLHRINFGKPLLVFGKQKKMKIVFVCNPQTDMVFIFSHISMVVGNNSNLEKIELETKQGLSRVLRPDHRWFKNREGILSTPLMNYWYEGIAKDELKNLRSEYLKITLIFDYNGKQQKIVSSSISVRQSYT